MRLVVRPLGLVSYPEGLLAQEAAADEVRAGACDGVLLALRHPPTVTLGRRAAPGDVHVDRWARRLQGVGLFHVERGGGATYHDPGQAVVYPVLHLDRLGLAVGPLLDAVGRAVIGLLADRGVEARWDPDRPGAWVGAAKIASVGFHLSGGVTTHGVSLNVDPDLAGFSLIDPCRMPGLAVTSLARLAPPAPDPDAAALDLARRLASVLEAGRPPSAVDR